jgi:xanthine dehydrogenase accessory factor
MSALGFGVGELDRIAAPIGLDIGARSPEEIALATMAQIIAARNSR